MAALTLGVASLPFSWPFLATVPILLLISLPLSHGGILGSWWRALPPPRAMYWLLAGFVTLSVVAAAIGRLPVAATIGVCGLADVANARPWSGVTRAVVRREASRRRLVGVVARHPAPLLPLSVPLAPVAMVLAIAMVVGLTRLAFVIGNPPLHTSLAAAAAVDSALGNTAAAAPGAANDSASSVAPGRAARDPVLEIRGFGSACCASPRSLRPVAPGALVQQFSCRGMTASGRPFPQGSSASDLPLTELGRRIAAQVLRLHQETGRPVDIIAESEGTLGADAMLATRPGLPLGSVVMMSPIVAPGRVTHPGGNGRGLMPAGELRALVWFVGGLSPFGSYGAQRLIGSVDEVGARFAASAARHPPLRWLLLVPLADPITAVGSSLLQGKLSQRLGGKPVYLAGLCANLAAMILLIASRFVMGSQPVAYPLLLATACLGVGFGLTVPSINTFTAAFHPDTVDRSVLVLNSLLGLGTTLAPVFVTIFVGTPVPAPPASAVEDPTVHSGTHQLDTTQLGTTGRSPMLWHSSQRWLKHGTSPATQAARAVAGAVQIWQRAAFASAACSSAPVQAPQVSDPAGRYQSGGWSGCGHRGRVPAARISAAASWSLPAGEPVSGRPW